MKQKFSIDRQVIYLVSIPFTLLLIILLYGCQHGKGKDKASITLRITATNNSNMAKQNVFVALSKADLLRYELDIDFDNIVVFSAEEEIPSQNNDESLYFIIDQISPDEEINFSLKNGKPGMQYTKKTQAEISVKEGGHFENRKYIGGDFKNVGYLRVPDEHTDHSYDIRYEGHGWESDLVGYRYYLDSRNATDVFGKKTPEMVLQQVGLDGFDSYHEMQDWGADVLKVGSSLGIGSLGMYINNKAVRVDKTDSITCEIIENGVVRSAIKTNYYGWKVAEGTYDIESVLSIHAGSRLTKHQVKIEGKPDNLCTGIGKDTNAKLYTDHGDGDSWGYLATYGLQSLNKDLLGLAVLFENKDYKGFTEDEFSHIVKLNADEGLVKYYFLAAWEGEHSGIANETAFLKYVKETAQNLSTPIEIELTPN